MKQPVICLSMAASGVEDFLRQWCADKSKNGISQHDPAWLAAKATTVGGSSIAIIKELNPYTDLYTYLAIKLGLMTFQSDIKPQWGNLFEDVIKREVELMYKCTVHGEDLYIDETKYYGTSYSPDGLGVVDDNIVLFEFKCPQRRIPGREPPAYYVPQVKMGLELLELTQYGIYVEAIYRRCTWEQLGPEMGFDTLLVPRPVTGETLSYGIIGFYTTVELAAAAHLAVEGGEIKLKPGEPSDDLLRIPNYLTEYLTYDAMNDLGSSTPALFENLMMLMDGGYLRPWYGSILKHKTTEDANIAINGELSEYKEFCRKHGHVNYGILPWKLLLIRQHRIEREPGYLDEDLPKIQKIVDFIKGCAGKTIEEKRKALDEFMGEYYGRSPTDGTALEEYEPV